MLQLFGVVSPGAVVGNSRFGGVLVRPDDINPHWPIGVEVFLGSPDAGTDDVKVSLAKVGGHEVGGWRVDGGVPAEVD